MKHRLIVTIALSISLIISLTVVSLAAAQVSLPGGVYTENFNALANAGTSSAVPAGWAFLEAGSNADATYAAGTGSNNAGNTYSFGSTGSTERAFGELSSGSLVSTLGVQFQNQTGSTVGRLSIQYVCEQWRRGSTAADALTFEYSTNATALNTGTWTPFASLNCNTVTTTGNNIALDGNLPANRAQISATITGLSIADNSTFWLRWRATDATGNDDGLAIDDFSLNLLTPTAINLRTMSASDTAIDLTLPLALLCLGLTVAVIVRRRSQTA